MASVSNPRLKVLARHEQHDYRTELMERHRDSDRYRNIIIQNLCPLWKSIRRDNLPVHGDLWAFKAWKRHDDDDTRTYTTAVEFFTSRLNLTWQSVPASWATEFLHWDVKLKASGRPVGGSAPPLSCPFRSPQRFEVGIAYDPPLARVFVSVHGTEIDSVEVPIIGHVSDPRIWDYLESVATDTLRDCLKAARNNAEVGLTSRNRTTRRRRSTNIHLLFQHVHYGAPVHAEDRKRISRLAEYIGLDFPRIRMDKK